MNISEEYMNELVSNRIISTNDNRFILNNNVEYAANPSIAAFSSSPLTYITEGFVEQLVAKSNYDELVGYDQVVQAGQWGMDTIQIRGVEYTGEAQPYIEYSNQQKTVDVNFSSYTTGIRYYETSWAVDSKELAGAELQNIDLINRKVIACAERLSEERAKTNVFGYIEEGKTPVSGLLTDKNLLPYVSVEPLDNKTGDQLYDMVNKIIGLLNEQSKGIAGDKFDSGETFRLGLPAKYRNLFNRLIANTSRTAKEIIENTFNNRIKIVYMKEFDGYEDKNVDVGVLFINQSKYNPTVKSMYIEKARFFNIHEEGHVTTQIVSSAIAGSILFQPSLFLRIKFDGKSSSK